MNYVQLKWLGSISLFVSDALVHTDVGLSFENFLCRRQSHDLVTDISPLSWLFSDLRFLCHVWLCYGWGC